MAPAPATTSKETIEDLFLGRWRPDGTLDTLDTYGWCTGYVGMKCPPRRHALNINVKHIHVLKNMYNIYYNIYIMIIYYNILYIIYNVWTGSTVLSQYRFWESAVTGPHLQLRGIVRCKDVQRPWKWSEMTMTWQTILGFILNRTHSYLALGHPDSKTP